MIPPLGNEPFGGPESGLLDAAERASGGAANARKRGKPLPNKCRGDP